MKLLLRTSVAVSTLVAPLAISWITPLIALEKVLVKITKRPKHGNFEKFRL